MSRAVLIDTQPVEVHMGANLATKERTERARHKVEDATKSARHSAAESLVKAATLVEPAGKRRRLTAMRVVLLLCAAAFGAWAFMRNGSGPHAGFD
jgi:hypothetical protein